jgi:DNA repair protein SbcC/Rad50
VRPLLLSLEGFSCYSDQQPPLDFARLQLFGIVGPTGAGKSSILDAMTYALYGYVPRLGKAGNDLITAGRDRLVARFDFGVGHQRYRITRTLRRNRPAKVIFENVTNGEGTLIADKVADANQAVERLLGIGFEGFSQSVILPQGQFDRFLRSQGGARRAVLTELLRLERYERMRRLAVQSRDKTAVEVESLERQLADYAEATPDALETLRLSVVAAGETVNRSSAARTAAEATASRLRSGHQMTRELEEKEEALRKLLACERTIEGDRASILASRRAEPVIPLLQAASEARKRANDAHVALTVLEDEARDAKRALDEAARSVDTATKVANGIPAMRERIQALDRLHGTFAHLRQVLPKLDELKIKTRQAADAVGSAKQGLNAAAVARDEQRLGTERARAAREAVTFDPSLQVVIEPLLVDASRAETIEADVVKRRKGVQKAHDVAQAAESAALNAEEQLTAAQSELLERQRQLEGLEHEVEHARMSHMASELRGTLNSGDACPVCAQAIEVVPLAEEAPELETVKAARARAAALVAEARGRQDQWRQEAAGKQAKASERRAHVGELEAELQPLEAQLSEIERRLTVAVAGFDVALAGGELREWITREVAQARRLRDQAESAQKSLDDAERNLLAAEHAVEKAEQTFQASNEAHTRIDQELRDTIAEQKRLEDQIAQVTSEPDPDVERDKLQREADALAVALRDAQQTLDDTQRKYDGKAAQSTISATTARQRDEEARDADQQALAACSAAGFADEKAVKSAVLSEETQRTVSERIQQYETARAQAETRQRELKEALGEQRVTAAAVAGAESVVAAAQHAHNTAITETARLRGLLERLEKDLAKAQQLTRDLGNARSRLAVSEGLARDLGGDRFQQYLLEETFEQLVRGASVRLKQLTNRYTLKWEDDQFFVVDHDNAREQRVAQTLSGGETFLASLALALELSDQILRTAGAVRVDSLFIDEGFGSLDPQSLDVAANAIEGLQAGGRMVGIITHLDTLAERLPGCVRIDKRPVEGSLWNLERAG